MHRDIIYVYVAHVSFYVRCSYCVRLCWNVCVAGIVRYSVFRVGVVKCVCVGRMMDVVFLFEL